MDREVFKKALEFQMSDKGRSNDLTVEQQLEIVDESIRTFDKKYPGKFSGYQNTIIIAEELTELNQEMMKALRGKPDRIGIIEELADVSLGIDYAQKIFGITDEELHQARTIKMQRVRNNLSPDSSYC